MNETRPGIRRSSLDFNAVVSRNVLMNGNAWMGVRARHQQHNSLLLLCDSNSNRSAANEFTYTQICWRLEAPYFSLGATGGVFKEPEKGVSSNANFNAI